MKRLSMTLGALVLLALAGCGRSAAPTGGVAADTPVITPVPGASTPSAAATAATAAAAVKAGDSLARFDGYGDMRFGMGETAFRAAWQGELAGQLAAAGTCSYLHPRWVKQPRDFGFMFEQGHFVRYDVGTVKVPAPGGGRVGMDVADIRALYGAAMTVGPHKYVKGAGYLRVAAPDGQGVLVFETDANGTVTRWRVGLPPQIDYVEGCA